MGVLYRPAQKKVENAKARDFLGKAKRVPAESTNDPFTEFTGVARLKQGITPSNVFIDDGPTSNLSRAATVAAPGGVSVPSTYHLRSLLTPAATADCHFPEQSP